MRSRKVREARAKLKAGTLEMDFKLDRVVHRLIAEGHFSDRGKKQK